MVTILWIGLGGFLGANSRYFVEEVVTNRFGSAFPWGTFSVNIVGSFIIGIIAETLAIKVVDNPAYNLFLVVGFLGGFTTFSSFAHDSVNLFENDKLMESIAYIVGTNAIAITFCVIGVALARRYA